MGEINGKIAIIGAGISGLSIANLLKDRFDITVFEKENRPGGLIKCKRINGALYHLVGGHVFNTKRKDVFDWFWSHFDKEKEFSKINRNAVIKIDDKTINYPIENFIYQLGEENIKNFIQEIPSLINRKDLPSNFEDFLINNFGKTLYDLYFKPYNTKLWRQDLKQIPLSWLEGKLPMPNIAEILYNNFCHFEEKNMVHSTFYYPQHDGSQFIANRIAENIPVFYNIDVCNIKRNNKKWVINEDNFDKIIYCGNIKQLPNIIEGVDLINFKKNIDSLNYHGTTSVLCSIKVNPYSWIYLPDSNYLSHRIICTGNFADSNNGKEENTAVIEFTDYISKEDIYANLQKVPFSPQYLAHKYTKYTYPIQNRDTRTFINNLKCKLKEDNFFLLGRFAEWEYYNMDAAIGAAVDLNCTITN